MSSVATQYAKSNTNSVFISFGVKWTLKAEELRALSAKKISALHSDLYTFKAIEDLSFYFCMENQVGFSPYPYEISVKGSKMWSVQLLNHFILTKDRAYSLWPLNPVHMFLEIFRDRCIPKEEENVEVHCVVSIWPADPASPMEDEPLDCRRTVDIESVPYPSFPNDYKNEKVISFVQKGEIPLLSVDMALQIISETNIHKCDVLKILCMEYLMQNTNAQNLRKILTAAIEFDMPRLERRCTEKISKGCFRIS